MSLNLAAYTNTFYNTLLWQSGNGEHESTTRVVLSQPSVQDRKSILICVVKTERHLHTKTVGDATKKLKVNSKTRYNKQHVADCKASLKL